MVRPESGRGVGHLVAGEGGRGRGHEGANAEGLLLLLLEEQELLLLLLLLLLSSGGGGVELRRGAELAFGQSRHGKLQKSMLITNTIFGGKKVFF